MLLDDYQQQFLSLFLMLADEIGDVIDKEETSMLKNHIMEQQARLCHSLPAERLGPPGLDSVTECPTTVTSRSSSG